jgi:hypothetical protein
MKLPIHSISFDFDATLSLISVQTYAKSLIEKGHDVWVITSRLPDGADPRYTIRGMWIEIDNSDLFKVTDLLGINRDHIIFTSHEKKSKTINKLGIPFIFHLDDDFVELNHINRETKTHGISCFGTTNWKQKCNKLV